MNKNTAESRRAAKLVKAKPEHCWENAAKLMSKKGYDEAIYVEAAVICPTMSYPEAHAWVVLNGKIIDPTLPELELSYFPAHQWSPEDFDILIFKYKNLPFYKHVEFLTEGVQVEMDRAKAAAAAFHAP